MKNGNKFVVGLILGVSLATGGTVMASSSELIIQNVKFKINEILKEIPSNYEVLNYNGHTYVPTRFIAEELGAEVIWDEKTKTVIINQSKDNLSDENDSETTAEETPTEDKGKFSALPVSKMVKGVSLEIYEVEKKDNYTRFFIRIDNTASKRIQLSQSATTLTTSDSIYKQTDSSGYNVLYWNDNSWYKDIEEDKTIEGYVTLPPIPKDEKSGQIYLETIVNDYTQEPIEFKFDIKWE